jgi:hypothetical protein
MMSLNKHMTLEEHELEQEIAELEGMARRMVLRIGTANGGPSMTPNHRLRRIWLGPRS